MRHRRRSHAAGIQERAEDRVPGEPTEPAGPELQSGSRETAETGGDVERPGSPPPIREVHMDRGSDRSPEVSVVGRGTRIEGKVMAAGSLRVEGEVKGSITARGDVSLSPEGRVEANIDAKGITLAGQVKGNLNADGDVSLPADSRLDGNIQAHNVVAGGTVNGDIVARGRVELGPGARVEGDITSQSLVVAAGAVFLGRSIMGEHRAERSAAS
jgi:cytoskeletal protein CcmA (bactofilin family)